MTTNPIAMADELQTAARDLLANSPLLELLKELGEVTQTGSSVMGLMAYPDIDFAIQNQQPQVQAAIDVVPVIFSRLQASACKVADFSATPDEGASYYLGIDFPYAGRSWHIDATAGRPGPIITNPPELADWLAAMNQDQRLIILRLKKELIDAKRYAGARSRPPYTFRSAHLYEAVLKGGAATIADVEQYFR